MDGVDGMMTPLLGRAGVIGTTLAASAAKAAAAGGLDPLGRAGVIGTTLKLPGTSSSLDDASPNVKALAAMDTGSAGVLGAATAPGIAGVLGEASKPAPAGVRGAWR